jgi:hypothetical protein
MMHYTYNAFYVATSYSARPNRNVYDLVELFTTPCPCTWRVTAPKGGEKLTTSVTICMHGIDVVLPGLT